MRFLARTFLLALLPAAAAAHTVDVMPARVRLKADAGALRVTVQVNARSWFFITGLAIPEGDAPWSDELRQTCMNYFASHFPLFVDGRPLEGRVLGGRLAQPLWKGEVETVAVIEAVYVFPSSGTVFSGRANFFREDWESMEGAGGNAGGARRDFSTLLRWSPWPGGARRVSIREPEFSLPFGRVLRAAPGRWLESAWIGIKAALETGGGLLLLFAALLAPPPLGRRDGAFLAAAGAAGFLLPSAAAAEPVLWLAAVAAGGALFARRPGALWRAGLLIGLPCAARVCAAGGAALREATAFSSFAWPAFWAGPLFLAAAAAAGRAGFKVFYGRYFAHLTPDEIARQALFHRRMAAVLVGIAGVTRVMSPLWAVRP